ncbi:MAG TPA: aminotransferase class I/II-fold pyridoxal phosphate-dependent enzyme, partial [Gemmatimonadaceae bacterium]|nr:aminotransferase class I/II-fold pyridoxal phosphate-dependent enzyme [Gemmatimonadaceae bacterium]
SDRLLVVRTMSKAFGLAGLRVGYAAGAPALVAEVEKSRGPYKVNALAERAALAALREDLPWVRARIAEAVTNRERLADGLRAIGLAPLPSNANFVLVPVTDAAALAQRLRDAGVAVRPFSALPTIGDALRISVGPWEMMEECLHLLDAALGESGSREAEESSRLSALGSRPPGFPAPRLP